MLFISRYIPIGNSSLAWSSQKKVKNMANEETCWRQLNPGAIFSSSPLCFLDHQPRPAPGGEGLLNIVNCQIYCRYILPHTRPRCCSRWHPAPPAACWLSPCWPQCAAGGRGGGWWQRGSQCGQRSSHPSWESINFSVSMSKILREHKHNREPWGARNFCFLTQWNRWQPYPPGRSLAHQEEGRAEGPFWDESKVWT